MKKKDFRIFRTTREVNVFWWYTPPFSYIKTQIYAAEK